MLTVQFVGSDREALRHEPDLSVSVLKLRAAFHWLSLNSWPFMQATKQHSLWETGSLDDTLESLLKAYELSVGGVSGGAPTHLVESASQIPAERVSVVAAGPANCTPSVSDLISSAFCVDDGVRKPKRNMGQETDSKAAESKDEVLPDADESQCAAVLDGGVDEIAPVQIWDAVMRHYKIAQKCDEELAKLNKKGNETQRQEQLHKRLSAIAHAVNGLGKLQHQDTIEKLRKIICAENAEASQIKVGLSSEFLNNRDPMFWCWSFMRLFPRGDCSERCPERTSYLPQWRWAKCLLMRQDFTLWRLDVEFVASLYNVFLRRDQINAVEISMKSSPLSRQNQEDIQKLTAVNLVAYALSSGDVNSVRDLLKRKNLDGPLRNAFQHMQVIQRNVRGSEAEKDDIIPKFMALRLWSGCSSLFFTLNPHDIRSPLTLLFIHEDTPVKRKFSLEMSNEEVTAYMKEFLGEDPRRLHSLVAANPLAATRCFHWTVRLVIRTLFNCADKPASSSDGVCNLALPFS